MSGFTGTQYGGILKAASIMSIVSQQPVAGQVPVTGARHSLESAVYEPVRTWRSLTCRVSAVFLVVLGNLCSLQQNTKLLYMSLT